MANKNLKLLLAGRFVSDTGSRMQLTVIPLYILDTGGTAASMGRFTLLSTLPLFLLLPFAGVAGDRFNRKKIMLNSDLIAGALILSLSALAFFDMLNLALLIAVQMAVSIVSVFFEASSGGMPLPLPARKSSALQTPSLPHCARWQGSAAPLLELLSMQ